MQDDIWSLSPYKQLHLKMLNAGPLNRDLRSYVVNKIKAPLMYSIIKYGKNKRPATLSHNGQILSDIGELFLKYEKQDPLRQSMFSCGLNLLLAFYENPTMQIPLPIVIFGRRLPEPTFSNTDLPNTHILMQIQKEFFEVYPEKDNEPHRMLFRILIVEYHHDPYYRRRLDWWLEQLASAVLFKEWQDRDSWMDWLVKRLVHYAENGYWKPRQANEPTYLWDEPPLPMPWGRFDLNRRIKPFVPEEERVYTAKIGAGI